MSRPRIAALAAIGLLAALIAFLALRASPYLQYIPWMPRRLGVWADSHGISRTFVAFFGLALVSFLLVSRRPWLALALCGFGTAIEVAQLWIPSRRFDPKDIAATCLGVLAAWPLGWWLRRQSAR